MRESDGVVSCVAAAPMQPDGDLKLCSQPVYDTTEEEAPYENEWVLEAEEK